MTFDEAKGHQMPFGKHKGRTLIEIAGTDEGLLYLDWAAGTAKSEPIRTALATCVTEPCIADSIEAAMEEVERCHKAR